MLKIVQGEFISYEVNENGHRKVIKSLRSTKRAFVRFTNCSSRTVDIWWRDFHGIRRRHTSLAPGDFSDINTYRTHPWEFTDADTAEHFVVNNNLIFRAPAKTANRRSRKNWNITVPVFPLWYIAMLVIALLLPNKEAATQLNLPKTVESDLTELKSFLKNR